MALLKEGEQEKEEEEEEVEEEEEGEEEEEEGFGVDLSRVECGVDWDRNRGEAKGERKNVVQRQW